MSKLRSKSSPFPQSSVPFTYLYQPVRWQPDYSQRPSGSSSPKTPPTSGHHPRSSIPHSGSRSSLLSNRNSGVNLDTIPEDHFLDRGTDFRFVGGIRNPAFEMNEMTPLSRNTKRRFSEGDVLDRSYDSSYSMNDNFPFRSQNAGSNNPGVEDNRQDKRRSRDVRGETRSEVSVGGRSAQSGRSGRADSVTSDKSEDTKLSSVTSSRNDRRRSEAGSRSGERRPSAVPSRRSTESGRSSVSTTNSKTESTVLTASPIEIPIEFIETPATRIKKLFGPVIMCVLVITLAASLGAAIYFAAVLKEAQEDQIQQLKAQLVLSASGVNVQTMSEQQKQILTTDYCKKMGEFYKQSTLFKKTYKDCEVDDLSNSKITFTLYFEDVDEQAPTEESILHVLKDKATKGNHSKEVQVNNLKLDLKDAKVTLEKVKVENTTAAIIATTTTTTPAPTTKPTTMSSTTHSTTIHVRVATPKPQQATTATTTTSTRLSSTTATTTTTGDRCYGLSGEYFPHHRECNLYIQCHDGVSVTFVCPLGTVFDVKEKVCVIKTDDVVCPEKPPTGGYDWSEHNPWDPCRTSKGEQFFPYPEDCNAYIQCEYNKSLIRVCPRDTVFDIVKQNCVPPSPDVICYTITTATSPKAAALVQDTVTQVANTGSTSTLPPIVYPSRPVYSPEPCKEGTNGGLYPHPTNCSMYILCEFTNERIRSCAEGLYFDPVIKTCVQPKNDLMCPDIQPCKGLTNGFFPHPKACNKFIVCKDRNEVIERCMGSDVWDARKNSCVTKTDSISCPEEST